MEKGEIFMEIVMERISQSMAPMSLLLLADPSHEQIVSYLQRGIIYVAKHDEHVVGVYVLLETRPNTMEIINIAVLEEVQGQGVGKQLLQHAITVAKEKTCIRLKLGQVILVFHSLLSIKNIIFEFFLLILITFRSIMKKRLLKMGLYAVI